MPIKVLVLCQRKKGRCNDSSSRLVEHNTVPTIKKYLNDFLHSEDYTIDYLSDLDSDEPPDGVDFNIKIGDNEEFIGFLRHHTKYYSVIILNTCPFAFMQFGYIRDLLVDSGVVILSKVNCSDRYSTDLFDIPPTDNAIMNSNITSFFRYDNHGFYRKAQKKKKSINKTNKSSLTTIQRIRGPYRSLKRSSSSKNSFS
jgi:hypothetical protein